MIREVTMYQAVCDGCGRKTGRYNSMEKLNANGDFWAWVEIDGKLYCPDCHEYDKETDSYKPKNMERKIGEIFEYNGEWYQCVKDTTDEDCGECDFQCYCKFEVCGFCSSDYREDKQSVCFKKLEKVGEPYAYTSTTDKIYNVLMQQYKVYYDEILPLVIGHLFILNPQTNTIAIEIKQTKEDMEERETLLPKEDNPLGESVHYYLSNGKVDFDKQNDEDLMMLPEKKEGWVNVYKDSVYDTKDEALIGRSEFRGYIDTIKINWSE